jgi:hypothetical protein
MVKIFLRFLSRPGSTNRQYITGLTLEHLTNPFQGVEGDSLCLVLLQPPQRGVTYASLFGQPVERSLMLFQQFVDSDSNHATPGLL